MLLFPERLLQTNKWTEPIPDLLFTEAVTQMCSWENVFLKYPANLQENTHADV